MTQIQIFAVHEERRAETAQGSNSSRRIIMHAPDTASTSTGTGPLSRNARVPQRRAWEELAEPVRINELIPHCRQGLHATRLHTAIGVQETTSENAGVWVGAEMLIQPIDGIVEDFGVRVQQQQRLRAACATPRLLAAPKPTLTVDWTNRTLGNSRATCSRQPSKDALSTTMTSDSTCTVAESVRRHFTRSQSNSN